jgi:glucose-6-phosphate isomerase
MRAEAVGVFLDYSKNRIIAETLRLLLDLVQASGLRARIDAMFRRKNSRLLRPHPRAHTGKRIRFGGVAPPH